MKDNTPRVNWQPIGDSFQISANKTIILLNLKEPCVKLGVIHISETDEKGDLWDYHTSELLKLEDYTHYSYACLPLDYE